MKKRNKSTYFLLLFLVLNSLLTQNQVTPVRGWSSLDHLSHYPVGVAATQIIAEPWLTFFNNNLTGIGDASDYPDAHKGVDPLEYARHFDDSDVPHDDHTSVGLSDDWSWGVISWAAENATKKLTELIKSNASNADLIYQFGFVSHYAADSTMPFHATKNFNGQDTGNDGVHSKIEELIFKKYGADVFDNITLRSPQYVDDVYAATKENIASGLALVPSYLEADTLGVAAAVAAKNQGAYTTTFYNLLNESIINRIELAVQFTADLWFTAITDAEPPTSSTTSVSSTSTTTTSTTTSTTSTTTTLSSSSSLTDDSNTPLVGLSIFVVIPILRSKFKSIKK
ncbi:MAG: hypothetical protein GPJ54_15885 [Candidatus Heimdallarchaeota archaeon]|nr:hypothetical protein [Candidatus Heimdallarchaeota archaeon]